MPRFRKKPLEVEAMRYEPGTPACQALHDWLGLEHADDLCWEGLPFAVDTREGLMTADPGDWIVREPNPTEDRRFYPVKASIFAATYEPAAAWDVVVDDPEMLAKHELRGVEAPDAKTATTRACREAFRREGYRVMGNMPAGDERTLDVVDETTTMYATTHVAGAHPDIDYSQPARRLRLLDGQVDPRTGLPAFEWIEVTP